jgi:membrane peptidoglycan carboxypeptidase
VPPDRILQEPFFADRVGAADTPPPKLDAIVLPFPGERRLRTEPPTHPRTRRYIFALLCVLALGAAVYVEIRTSVLQSVLFTRWGSKLQYKIERGRSEEVAFPAAGPFDERRGYTKLAQFSLRVRENGFHITEQVRQTPELTDLIQSGIAPPFPEPPVAGLVIRDASGALLYDTASDDVWRLKSLDSVPPIMVRTLLFIENRSIGDGSGPRENPAIDWVRSSKALVLYAGRTLGLHWPLEGGSTLATQLVKFHHSPGGRTGSPLDKLRQVIGASLAAYHEGPDTRATRNQVILDYLNTMPLGAAPGVGEVNGLTEGLRVWFAENPGEVLAALKESRPTPEKARAYKTVLALLYAVHAPTYYLVKDRRALLSRIDAYTGLLRSAGVIDPELSALLLNTPLNFAPPAPVEEPAQFVEHKAANAVRTELGNLLGVPNQYGLDRLDARIYTTIDGPLQTKVTQLLRQLGSSAFVAANDLRDL